MRKSWSSTRHSTATPGFVLNHHHRCNDRHQHRRQYSTPSLKCLNLRAVLIGEQTNVRELWRYTVYYDINVAPDAVFALGRRNTHTDGPSLVLVA